MSNTIQRDKTKAVIFKIPQNAAVQIYDYKEGSSRVVFGPDLVMLEPDEAFTILSLSGGKPKKPNLIKALALILGPDFMTDIFTVETSDHARLNLKLSYNWHFDVDRNDPASVAKLFQVPDFVGDACKSIASRVRGVVAGVKFDEFHRNSARIIRTAVFGIDENEHVRDEFRFKANNLVITNIDIQSVEPVDEETLKSLQKSVQIAIQITTNAQEATAKHEASKIEQEAIAKLDRQKIIDQKQAEVERKQLLELEAENVAIETTGKATAEAKAKAETDKIQGEAEVQLAQQEAEAKRIRETTELELLKAGQEAELIYQKTLNDLEIEKSQKLAEIRTEEFKNQVEVISPEVIKEIAKAGHEMKVKLLQALGLNSTLITDGKNPINLFTTANGLVGGIVPTAKVEKTEDTN